jgi:UDP-N-acetylmuramyl pentapeptide synthase
VLTDPAVIASAMKSVGKSMNEIAVALRELGITPAAIAQVLLDVFNPAPMAVAFALKAAGCTQPEVQEAILGVFTQNLQQVAEILASVF